MSATTWLVRIGIALAQQLWEEVKPKPKASLDLRVGDVLTLRDDPVGVRRTITSIEGVLVRTYMHEWPAMPVVVFERVRLESLVVNIARSQPLGSTVLGLKETYGARERARGKSENGGQGG